MLIFQTTDSDREDFGNNRLDYSKLEEDPFYIMRRYYNIIYGFLLRDLELIITRSKLETALKNILIKYNIPYPYKEVFPRVSISQGLENVILMKGNRAVGYGADARITAAQSNTSPGSKKTTATAKPPSSEMTTVATKQQNTVRQTSSICIPVYMLPFLLDCVEWEVVNKANLHKTCTTLYKRMMNRVKKLPVTAGKTLLEEHAIQLDKNITTVFSNILLMKEKSAIESQYNNRMIEILTKQVKKLQKEVTRLKGNKSDDDDGESEEDTKKKKRKKDEGDEDYIAERKKKLLKSPPSKYVSSDDDDEDEASTPDVTMDGVEIIHLRLNTPSESNSEDDSDDDE